MANFCKAMQAYLAINGSILDRLPRAFITTFNLTIEGSALAIIVNMISAPLIFLSASLKSLFDLSASPSLSSAGSFSSDCC
jgi:hypothetical protein